MSLVSCAAHRVRALVLTLLQLMKRLLCLFQKRRRKPSGDLVDMQDVVVESAYPSSHNSGQHGERLVAWNTWDDAEPTPATVEDHIDQYRKQLTKLRHQGAAAAAAAEACAEPDFFNDMTPDIDTRRSLEVRLPTRPPPRVTFEVQEDFAAPVLMSPELGDILDDDDLDGSVQGWDAEEDLTDIIRQQRIEEHRRKKLSKQKLLNQ